MLPTFLETSEMDGVVGILDGRVEDSATFPTTLFPTAKRKHNICHSWIQSVVFLKLYDGKILTIFDGVDNGAKWTVIPFLLRAEIGGGGDICGFVNYYQD